jgi:seryl-tRNA synthetase
LKLKNSLAEADELFKYFEENKIKCQKLDTKIKDLENGINELIYDLYNLSSDEVAEVEK